MRPRTVVPSTAGEVGEYARRFARAMGSAYQGVDASAVAQDFITWGEALQATQQTNKTSLNQAFLDSATDMLLEHERLLDAGVRPLRTDADRQTRLLAKHRAAFAGTAQNIQIAIRTYDPTTTLQETDIADAYPGATETVYEFGVVVTETYFDIALRREIESVVATMKPAHTRLNVASSGRFYCDGYLNSRTDDTLLGG